MTRNSEQSNSVSVQAAQWWVVFHDDEASADERREFAEWVALSPEHVEAYLRVARTHAALSRADLPWPKTSADVLIRDSRLTLQGPAVLPHQWTRPEHTSSRRFALPVAIGLAVFVMVAIVVGWLMLSQPQQLQTKFGEERSFLLADGSRATLNTASKIEVRLQPDRRVIDLVQGEALFEVAPDASRPFEVRVGKTSVRAVGTQFDIDQRPARTTVTIVQGRVALDDGATPAAGNAASPANLTAGDRVIIGNDAAIKVSHGVNVEAATAWTHHLLVFDRRPLGEVAAEFNRYNLKRIEIRGAQLLSQAVTGTFQSNDPVSFVTFVGGMPGVRVSDEGKGGYRVTLGDSGTPDK